MTPTGTVDTTPTTILVLGGNGFIGKHIVAALHKTTATVIVGTTGQDSLRPFERRIHFQDMLNKQSWLDVITGIDVIVNAVGILRETPDQSFEAVHHHAVKALAEACHEQRTKLIHISAIGLHEALKAPFSASKRKGELAIIHSGADWQIIRASLVEGDGAYGAGWFKKIARWPVHFIPAKNALLSPVNVQSIAAQVVSLLSAKTSNAAIYHRIYEISDGIQYTLPEYLVALNGGRKRPIVTVPDIFVRFVTRCCDLLNVTPLTYGHYELLTYDSSPSLYTDAIE